MAGLFLTFASFRGLLSGRVVVLLISLILCQTAWAKTAKFSIPSDRQWQALHPPGAGMPYRTLFRQAGRKLGTWQIRVAGLDVDGPLLKKWSHVPRDENFTRALREQAGLPFDPVDLLYFLDDVLRAGRSGLRGKVVWVSRGRARAAGILVHPDDVFRTNKPRRYGEVQDEIAIDKPQRQKRLEPANDGDLLGPRWSARYLNPRGEEKKLAALAQKRRGSDFTQRIRSLMQQLREQGCDVKLETTVRDQRRGYLMWGAFVLSRQRSRAALRKKVRMLQRAARDWQLEVPIVWMHPKGWRATVEAARQMADAYEVVYASRAGAQRSKHYDGVAVDFTAVALPRSVQLKAPDGARQSFDLSDPKQSRDLSLTPVLIDWIETHFLLQKLKFDYVHWNDTKVDDLAETAASSSAMHAPSATPSAAPIPAIP